MIIWNYSQAGTIIQTCIVTLTPETAQDGSQIVRKYKDCNYPVNTNNGSSPPSNGNGSGDSGSESITAAIPSSTPTATQVQDTNTVSTSSVPSGATAIDAPPISAIVSPSLSQIGSAQLTRLGRASVPFQRLKLALKLPWYRNQ